MHKWRLAIGVGWVFGVFESWIDVGLVERKGDLVGCCDVEWEEEEAVVWEGRGGCEQFVDCVWVSEEVDWEEREVSESVCKLEGGRDCILGN